MSDNTEQAEGLGSFFKNLGKIFAKAGKKSAANVLRNPSRALEIRANVANAAESINPKKIINITLSDKFLPKRMRCVFGKIYINYAI